MKTRFVGLALISMLLAISGCNKKSQKEGQKEGSSSSENRTINFSLEKSGFFLTNPISAWVKTVDVVCPNAPSAPDKIYTVTLADKDHQSFEIARDISGCTFKLKEFVADGLANRPTETALFVLNTTQTNIVLGTSGPVVSAYEYKNPQSGELLDRKLVSGDIVINKDGCPIVDATCDFRNTKVTFSYSELIRSDLSLINNLKIHSVTLAMEEELAPDCDVSAEFLQPAVDEALDLEKIKLKIKLNNCTKTFDSKILEYSLGWHTYRNFYQIKKAAGDNANVVGLHEAIDAAAKNFTSSPTAFEFVLTLAEIKALTGKTTTFAALREDFVLAIRNKGGKSIHYYVIDNSCTSDLADMITDKTASLPKTWTLTYPNPTNKALWQVSNWIPGKTFDDFCVDLDRSSANGAQTGQVISSYDLDRIYRLGIIEQPANIPLINFIINKYYNKTDYTWSDVQKAIWTLIDDSPAVSLGAYTQSKVDAIVADARANGATYVPVCSNDALFAIFLIPMNGDTITKQSTFAIVKPSDLGVTFCPQP